MPKLPTQKIGRAGELLTQFCLLKGGIESAPMTTDSGVDLVAYWNGEAVTVQVKSVETWKPAGGKGGLTLDWWIRDSKPVDYVSFVLVDEWRMWILAWKEVERMAFQHNKGNMHLGFYKDPNAKVRDHPEKRLRDGWMRYEGEHGIGRMKRSIEKMPRGRELREGEA